MTPNDVKIVAENIDDFIEVPNGLERLRKAVLTLAVAGKLVAQDKKEGNAEDLYTRIQSERVEKGGGRKKNTKEFAPVTVAEMPFDIPTSWRWVPLGSLFLDYGSGSTPSRSSDKYYSESGLNWYKSGELNDSILPIEAQEKVTELALKECRLRIFKPGDFLIAMYGATAGRIAVSQSMGTTNQAVWSGTPVSLIDDRYLYYYVLQSRQILIDKSSGAAQPNISGEKIIAHAFALPPLAEQKRIVAKVDEVMKQLDELETKKQERDETRTRLARSAMRSLGKGDSKIALEHLAELINTPTDLKELEGALLTLAVSGKLMPQDKKNGTAEDLYIQIQSNIESDAQGRKKKAMKPSSIDAEVVPFEIPKSWKWVRLGDIVKVDNGYAFKSSKYVEAGSRVIRITNVQDGFMADNNPKFIKEDNGEEFADFQLHEGDLLMSLTGYVGRVALFPLSMLPAVLNQRVARVVPLLEELKPYIFTYFQSGLFRSIASASTRGMAQQNMSTEWLKTHPIPLPPLAEQKRIVKKVEEVMALTNRIRQAIKE